MRLKATLVIEYDPESSHYQNELNNATVQDAVRLDGDFAETDGFFELLCWIVENGINHKIISKVEERKSGE